MGFFYSIKRAFGMGDDVEEFESDEVVSEEETIHEPKREPYINPFKQELASAPAPVADDKTESVATDEKAELFLPESAIASIAALINEVLPQSVKSYIDKDAQDRYIREALTVSLADFVRQVQSEAVSMEQTRLSAQVKEAVDKSETMQKQLADITAKNQENMNKFLSADRQRRALGEKIQEMEAKVMKAEADVEQYQLENKSLLNKLKVVQVKTDDLQFFKDENSRLSAEIARLKKQIAEVVAKNEMSAESEEKIKTLEANLEQAQNEIKNLKLTEVDSAEIEKCKRQIADLTNELAEQSSLVEARDKDIEQYRRDLKFAVGMSDSLREKAAEAESKLKASDARISEADLAMADLKEKLRIANDEIERLQGELEAAQDECSMSQQDLHLLEDVQRQLDKVEDLKKRKDEKISALTDTLTERDKTISVLENIVESLKKQIDDDRREFSLKIKDLSKMYEKQIKQQQEERRKVSEMAFDMTELEPIVEDIPGALADEPVVDYKAAQVLDFDDIKESDDVDETEKPEISAIDESKDDWLLSSPSMPELRTDEPVADAVAPSETKTPVRNDNSRQLSLF